MIIGRTQIQGACIGIERIVGLWLGWQAVQAIVNAFGQTDGKAVIKATNAYLNQLAASGQAGKDKATALAGFINEDPMMVCSLGLEPELTTLPKMPIRMLITDGNAWLDTGWTATGGMKAKIKAKILSNRTYYFGSHNTSAQGGTNDYNRNQFYIPNVGTNNARYNVMGKTQNDVANKLVFGGFNEIECSAISGTGILKVNGTSTTFAYSGTLNPLNTVVLFYYYYAPNQIDSEGTGCASIELWNVNDEAVREMYPFIRKVNNVATLGMIDVLHDQLYTNAGSGSFTEEFGYMQNGSWVTWTPSTP